jgi:hypothetical protein
MDSVRAGLGDEVIDAARAASVLRGHVELQLLEFFNRVLNWGVVCAAAQILIRHAVDKKAIEVFADSVDHRAVSGFHHESVHVDRAGRLLHQVIYVAAIQRQVG